MLGAAGRDSTMMQRLKAEIARHTGLEEVSEEGDLLVRLRPAPTLSSPSGRGVGGKWPSKGPEGGWDALVRLSPKPLATRDWRVCNIEGSLQATVAHAMALLTQPKPDDVYLNLCCGSGTLLIERALASTAQKLIGCDINPDALICANQNIATLRSRGDRPSTSSGCGHPYINDIALRDWDATRLPLPDASVDAIVADLPFGHRVGTHDDNTALYPALLGEAKRVAKPGAWCVLITVEIKLLEQLISAKAQWERESTLRINLGGLRPAIFVLRRV
jgi:23S rRNA G2445 N2-methylase RlmL